MILFLHKSIRRRPRRRRRYYSSLLHVATLLSASHRRHRMNYQIRNAESHFGKASTVACLVAVLVVQVYVMMINYLFDPSGWSQEEAAPADEAAPVEQEVVAQDEPVATEAAAAEPPAEEEVPAVAEETAAQPEVSPPEAAAD